MKKQEIAKQLARRSGVTQGEAADRLDRVVREILASVRSGKPAHLPGMGHFELAGDAKLKFRQENRPKEHRDV